MRQHFLERSALLPDMKHHLPWTLHPMQAWERHNQAHDLRGLAMAALHQGLPPQPPILFRHQS